MTAEVSHRSEEYLCLDTYGDTEELCRQAGGGSFEAAAEEQGLGTATSAAEPQARARGGRRKWALLGLVLAVALSFSTVAAVGGRVAASLLFARSGSGNRAEAEALIFESVDTSASDTAASTDEEDAPTTKTSTTTESCPSCAPTDVGKPDLVIPFFERDLCKLKYTAKSISVNDPDHFFGDVWLMWVSMMSSEDYKDDLQEAVEAIQKTHAVHLIDFSQQITTSAHLTGWFGQQLVKLKVASVVKSEYYVVMDAKNTLIKPFKRDMYFDRCNRGKIQAQFAYDKIPKPHIDWYIKSANALGVSKPDKGYWPASITPVLFHRQTVLRMLQDIGENSSINALCNGKLCRMLGCNTKSGHGATEFTLYTLYAYQKAQLECIHSVEKMQHFSVEYKKDWQGNMYWQMDELGLGASPALKENISIGDKDGFPLMWHPGSTHDVPKEASFPLKFDDLTKRWAASLWRGVKGNHKQLSAINIETLQSINQGFRQFPIMFGAQPASLKGMDEDRQKQAISEIVTLYKNAGLYDPDEQNATELIDCVVGWKND